MTTLPRRQALGIALGGAVALGTAGLTPAGAAVPVDAAPDSPDTPIVPPPPPVPVPLDAWFSNDGIDSASATGGDFDGSGYTFPAEHLPVGRTATVGGVPFRLGSAAAGAKNDIAATGQKIDLPKGRYFVAYFLVAASYGATGGTATVHYADGSTSTGSLSGPDWYTGTGALVAPFRYAPGGVVDNNPVSLATGQVWVDPAREAVALTLPVTANPAPNVSSLHVFALTLQPVAVGRSALVLDGRSTANLLTDGGPQAAEATIVNAGTVWLGAGDRVSVTVDVPGGRTAVPAAIRALAPGEQATVRLGLAANASVPPGTTTNGQIRVTAGRGTLATQQVPITLGIPDFRPTDASLSTHRAPYWFTDAKFGIFIHWGVYAVPAWAPVGQQYAEWYWQNQQDPNGATYAYHREKYGEDFAYDDFIPMFTAAKFDPRTWLKLIADAGAEYYVLTSKHHDGFALWDTKVSDRNSVKLGPKRNIIAELFAASRQYTPQLRNGLYFSLPEWFNPDNPWMGHAPRNPYTGAPLPYTGYTAGKDFVRDYQAPQVLELISEFDPDVLWFDIGGVNDSRTVLTEYFNRAKNRLRPKDVTYNDRGGIPDHDFTTPEYTTYPNTVVAKWEASRGLDPFSYGYNRATPDDRYMTAEEVVRTLVDIVSKNGNFLLDIGPDFDGTIPDVMQKHLRDAGAWLKVNGEAIYDTTYWSRMAQLGDLRFTVKPNEAFYVHSLAAPGSRLVVDAPVPIRAGDRVTMLGYRGTLHWTVENGSLVIDVPAAARQAGRYTWVFKIAWS
ncbi:alpha-L-fucosidase [Amycolatopsis nalaikhensis]|uniref:alpha-L-fucosidase n=1 Tax=Amycolatopsis nalaikhensis TaxID=715472 RepID=A0ABY8XG11_9PSEU|nr:alpha-L-fucosidase [Amycolatopsis sp. 2-2]WIV54540.1 alpha-L-fucosidase [Amycolatopsis sp. 2-2]